MCSRGKLMVQLVTGEHGNSKELCGTNNWEKTVAEVAEYSTEVENNMIGPDIELKFQEENSMINSSQCGEMSNVYTAQIDEHDNSMTPSNDIFIVTLPASSFNPNLEIIPVENEEYVPLIVTPSAKEDNSEIALEKCEENIIEYNGSEIDYLSLAANSSTEENPSTEKIFSDNNGENIIEHSGSDLDYVPSDHPDYNSDESSDNSKNRLEETSLLNQASTSSPTFEVEVSAERKNRRRKAQPASWQRNVRKKLRMLGQAYVDRKGKAVPAKTFKTVDCSKCRFRCSEKISIERQQTLFSEYWALGDSDRQKSMICSLVLEKPVERRRKRVTDQETNKEKGKSRVYALPGAEGENLRVCLKFFCGTFNISFQVIDLALRYKGEGGAYLGTDRRLGKQPANATTEDQKDRARKHIDSFPTMESHYCRKDSRKRYLSSDLNIAIMYRLYCDSFHPNEIGKPVSEFVYRSLFNDHNPSLSFYKPKKDQCTKCNQYNNASAADKSALEDDWKAHKKRQDQAMKMKEKDKLRCIENGGHSERTVSFDLQAILSVPFAGDAQIYYRRKLSVYNFTIYDAYKSKGGDGHCYIWDETCGGKGAAEIGTCLLMYLQNLPKTVTTVTTYSDTCGGQNRNKHTVAALLYAVNKIDHLETIDMKFMESGHSYLEADSMHATIERAMRHKKIYTTREWSILIQMARHKPSPYKVNVLEYGDIYDLQALSNTIILNSNVDTDGEKVSWLNIKWIRFEKKRPFQLQFKYALDEEGGFRKIDVLQKGRKERTLLWESIHLKQKYSKKLNISEDKKRDLLYFLEKGVIPTEYKPFILALPTNKKTKDTVPWPLSDDEDE